MCVIVFFFNDTATTDIYTLSLHDALPIWRATGASAWDPRVPRSASAATTTRSRRGRCRPRRGGPRGGVGGTEEHTSEIQSRQHILCRLLLEKKKTQNTPLILTYTDLIRRS